jgi:multidrug efflux pump subunit AcrB
MNAMADLVLRHPRVTLAAALIAAVLGVHSLSLLKVEEYPSLASPSFEVDVRGAAAEAEEADQTVAKEISDALSGLSGVKSCFSVCTEDGRCRTEVAFSHEDDPLICEGRLREALRGIDGARVVRRLGGEAFVCAWTVSGGELPVGVPDRRLVSRILAIDGVADVDVAGRRSRRATVALSGVKMAALGLDRAQVDSAIRSMGVSAGSVKDGGDFVLRIDDGIKSVEDLAKCVVRFDHQTLGRVMLGDIAEIKVDDRPDRAVLVDGEPAAVMRVGAKQGCDPAALARKVRSVVEEHASALPGEVRLKVCADAGERSSRFLRNAVWTPAASFLLVTLALLALWRSWRMAAIPMLAMAASVLSAFVVQRFAGWSFNALTVFGFVLVSGSLVDCSLMVVDMAIHERAGGLMDVRTAAGAALSRSFKTVLGGTAVSLICYLPLVSAGDATAGIYLQFACVACVALAFSAVFAATLAPVLFAAWCRPSVEMMEKRRPNPIIDAWRRFHTRMSCFWADHGVASLFVLSLAAAALLWTVWTSPPPGMPMDGVSGMDVELEVRDADSADGVEKAVADAAERLLSLDGVESVVAVAGEGVLRLHGSSFARMAASFRSTLGVAEAAALARSARDALSGDGQSVLARFFLHDTAGSGDRFCEEFYLSSGEADAGALAAEAEAVRERLAKCPFVEEVSCGAAGSLPRVSLSLDKPAAEAFGVSAKAVKEALSSRLVPKRIDGAGLKGAEGGVFVVEDPCGGDVSERLSGIKVPASGGAQVPLSSIGTVSVGERPMQVARLNGAAAVRFVVRTKDGVSGPDARRMLADAIAPHGPFAVEWRDSGPSGRSGVVKGDWKVLLLSLAFLYLLLVAFYESWRAPLAAAGCAILADLGAIWALRAFGAGLDIYAVVALMAVSGFAVKSSTLIVDAARREAAGAGDRREAAKRGARRMFNLSQMVVWTSLAGVAPLLFPCGVAHGSARALGIAAVAGLAVTAVAGLMFVPAWHAAAGPRRRRRG